MRCGAERRKRGRVHRLGRCVAQVGFGTTARDGREGNGLAPPAPSERQTPLRRVHSCGYWQRLADNQTAAQVARFVLQLQGQAGYFKGAQVGGGVIARTLQHLAGGNAGAGMAARKGREPAGAIADQPVPLPPRPGEGEGAVIEGDDAGSAKSVPATATLPRRCGPPGACRPPPSSWLSFVRGLIYRGRAIYQPYLWRFRHV